MSWPALPTLPFGISKHLGTGFGAGGGDGRYWADLDANGDGVIRGAVVPVADNYLIYIWIKWKMAEREGFEPPEDLRPHLISSQARSTGLRHLSSPGKSATWLHPPRASP